MNKKCIINHNNFERAMLMKKCMRILFIVLTVFVMVGCVGNFTPSERVEEMFNRYIKNDQKIMDELDVYIGKQNLSSDQKDKYKDIIKNEYATIKYVIKDEKINGDEAVVEVALEVKDLFKASKNAGEYLAVHSSEFYENGVYDKGKFVDYKLEEMRKYGETVNYNVYIDLIKKDGIWTIEQIDNETLEKIHGIYDYETDDEN